MTRQHQGQLHLLPEPQAVAQQALAPRFEHLTDAPDKLIDILIAKPRGRLITHRPPPHENRVW